MRQLRAVLRNRLKDVPQVHDFKAESKLSTGPVGNFVKNLQASAPSA
jgi:hypothetical protein